MSLLSLENSGPVNIYEMLDGRKVTVNWLDAKSLKKIKKKDWIVIRTILREQTKLVNHPVYTSVLKHDLKSVGFIPKSY
jgi:hypothetical protein